MSVLNITITKAKAVMPIETNDLPEAMYEEALILGLKAILNRGTTKITKEAYPNEDELKAAALKVAEKQKKDLMDGKIRRTGAKAQKVSGALMTEARRLARALVKDELKRQGIRATYVEASEITKAANAYIAVDPSILEKAQANLDAREEMKSSAVDISKIVSATMVSEKKKKKVEAEKAKAKEKLAVFQERIAPAKGEVRPN